MVSASVFSLADQGPHRGSVWSIVLGMLAGTAFSWLTAKLLEGNDWQIARLTTWGSIIKLLLMLLFTSWLGL